MYLKCELPDGYFRIFDDISDLVIPKERIMVNFPPPPKDLREGQTHGICVWDAIACMSEGGARAISHIVGMRGEKGYNDPDIDFIMNPRAKEKHEEVNENHDEHRSDEEVNCKPPMWQRYPHHQMIVFHNKKGVATVFVTQYPVYVCNEDGKTIEKIK